MANERRLNKSASRTPRHGSSTTTTIAASASSSGSGSSNGGSSTLNAISGGKKQSRQYRLPHPPVPHAQTSLLQSQRVPASVVAYPSARQAGYESPQVSDSRYYASQGGRGGGSQSQTTTSTAAGAERSLAPTTVNATDGSTEAAVPSADPDSMEAKKALNKWGALDSLSGSGTGTFGFGPLLFHHVDETPRDPYDTTNMMLNDPISFNPMSAISWARLDESPDSVDELDGDQSSAAAQKPDIAVAAATASAGTGGSSRQDGSSSSHAGYVDSPASTPASPRHGSGASYASDVSGSRTSSVAGSSVGNISRTFSDTSLVSPDTERSSAGVPPAFTSPPSSRTPHPHPSQQQQKQGSQAEVPVQYRTHQSQQQQQAYPTQKPTSSRSPTSHRAPAGHQPYTSESYTHTRPQQHAQHSNRHRHQQQQQTSQSRQPQQPQLQLQQAPAPPPSLPAHQATTDFLLCLGPHCSARFPTEQELAAHYRAEHAFTCTWTSCSAASFTSSNALAWHVNAEHYLVCPVPGCCGAMFASKRALDGHLKGEVVTSSILTPSGSSSASTPQRHPQQQQQPQPQPQLQPQQPHHHRARRRSKSPSFSPGHRPPQRTRR